VRDWSECLSPAQLGTLRLPSPRRASYDDACHAVHAQGIAAGPRALLDAVAGLERVELPHAERCCGAGGSYFLREPLLSRAMIAGKLEDLATTQADTLLSANPGCRLQWEAALARAGSGVLVQHPAELIAEALAPVRPHKTRS
jgi:glycolate oxidase iron-sulfur subunit